MSFPKRVTAGDHYHVIAESLCVGEQFIFPDDSQLISGVCNISITPDDELVKPVTVQLQHCAHITTADQIADLSFVVSHSHHPPYHFDLLPEGHFSVGSEYGIIKMKKFSRIAIIMKRFFTGNCIHRCLQVACF